MHTEDSLKHPVRSSISVRRQDIQHIPGDTQAGKPEGRKISLRSFRTWKSLCLVVPCSTSNWGTDVIASHVRRVPGSANAYSCVVVLQIRFPNMSCFIAFHNGDNHKVTSWLVTFSGQ
jgi:hypothetical protein